MTAEVWQRGVCSAYHVIAKPIGTKEYSAVWTLQGNPLAP
jgi:hypothetical protein